MTGAPAGGCLWITGCRLTVSREVILVANPLHTYANLSLLPDHSTTLGILAISQVPYAW
jgi:hypothetical protein